MVYIPNFIRLCFLLPITFFACQEEFAENHRNNFLFDGKVQYTTFARLNPVDSSAVFTLLFHSHEFDDKNTYRDNMFLGTGIVFQLKDSLKTERTYCFNDETNEIQHAYIYLNSQTQELEDGMLDILSYDEKTKKAEILYVGFTQEKESIIGYFKGQITYEIKEKI